MRGSEKMRKGGGMRGGRIKTKVYGLRNSEKRGREWGRDEGKGEDMDERLLKLEEKAISQVYRLSPSSPR